MLIIPPVVFRKHRGRIRSAASTAPSALTLVSAVYDDDEATLTLAFDRAIDVSGVVGTAIQLDDAEQAYLLFNATGGAELLDPMTVQFTLVSIGDPTGPGELLTATGGNGIKAVGGGNAWAGVTKLGLPFP